MKYRLFISSQRVSVVSETGKPMMSVELDGDFDSSLATRILQDGLAAHGWMPAV